jgi:hypothetical protein
MQEQKIQKLATLEAARDIAVDVDKTAVMASRGRKL